MARNETLANKLTDVVLKSQWRILFLAAILQWSSQGVVMELPGLVDSVLYYTVDKAEQKVPVCIDQGVVLWQNNFLYRHIMAGLALRI